MGIGISVRTLDIALTITSFFAVLLEFTIVASNIITEFIRSGYGIVSRSITTIMGCWCAVGRCCIASSIYRGSIWTSVWYRTDSGEKSSGNYELEHDGIVLHLFEV
ncbi:hypothetical protein X975_06601, partial [Stegodyphus mimosarum]